MLWEGTAVISVVDLLNGELGSSIETWVTSTLDGNEVTSIEDERFSDISEVADQEAMTIPAIKMELSLSCVPVMSVVHICYRLYPELPAPISACPCETKIWLGNGWAVLRKETFILWLTACEVPLAMECFILR
jgi:hypothetical protein